MSRNIIYSPEKWEQVNPVNKDIFERFIANLHELGRTKRTIENYYKDARMVLIKVLDDFDNKSIKDMDSKDFRKFNNWAEESGMSPARSKMVRAVLNLLITFYEDNILNKENSKEVEE